MILHHRWEKEAESAPARTTDFGINNGTREPVHYTCRAGNDNGPRCRRYRERGKRIKEEEDDEE